MQVTMKRVKMANQKDRSKFIKIDPNAETEGFKRSDHSDFATNAELKQREWTGVRHNSLTDCTEFWILGECKKMVTKETRALNPAAVAQAHVELFAMNPFHKEVG